MEVTLRIPDDLGSRITASGESVSRRALEGLALEEFKRGNLTEPELRKMLEFETRYELDGFLKSHGIFEEYTLDDLEQERADLRRLGF